jgi:hypothetical protein
MNLNEVVHKADKYVYRKIWGLFSSVNSQKNIFSILNVENRHFLPNNSAISFYRDRYLVEISFSRTAA